MDDIQGGGVMSPRNEFNVFNEDDAQRILARITNNDSARSVADEERLVLPAAVATALVGMAIDL